MIFEEIKTAVPSIKVNNKKSKKEDYIEINPNDWLISNGLTSGQMVMQRHSSCLIDGFYHQTTPALIKVIYREDNMAEFKELTILKLLQGQKHIAKLYEEIIKKEYAIFVFERIEIMPIDDILSKKLTLDKLKFILKSVLEGLEEAHRIGLVHRDLSLKNIIVTPNYNDVFLIGWGSSTKITDKMNTAIGSTSIRAPEMLMGFSNYNQKVDVWAFGVLILYFLSDGNIPWKGNGIKETLIEMAVYFGAQNLLDLEKKLYKHLAVKSLHKHTNDMIIPLETLISTKHSDLDDDNLMDLMRKCFTLDYRLRPSVYDLLNHNFFKE